MQATAQNWVVLTELSDTNAVAVGVTMALQFGPQLLLVPFSGAVADRFDRRKVLLVTQSLLMLLAFGLGLLLVLGIAELWHLYAFALALAEGHGEPEAIRFASAAAALKCTRFGGRSGAPARDEVEYFLAHRS